MARTLGRPPPARQVSLIIPIEPGVPVVIWRVDVAFLAQEDWKYERSTAGTRGGGRTHTFGVKKPAKRFRDCSVYRRHGIRIRAGKPVPENGA